jgi:hypothetical protein
VNAKGVCRLGDETTGESIVSTVKNAALSARHFYSQVKVREMMAVEGSRRPQHIMGLSDVTLGNLGRAGRVFEGLVQNQIKPADDIGDLVERGMLDAAKAIQDAARKLEELMSRPAADLNVHGSLLASALAITTAIANLIRCASDSQKEIVAHGAGEGTRTAFYKKNNKWSEGLLSAAKAVATGTVYLVEAADGLISGGKNIEQLIVAAKEVGGTYSTHYLTLSSRNHTTSRSSKSKSNSHEQNTRKTRGCSCRRTRGYESTSPCRD